MVLNFTNIKKYIAEWVWYLKHVEMVQINIFKIPDK